MTYRSLSARLLPLLFAALLPNLAHAAIETAARQAIIVDFTTGAVLLDKEADTRMTPSSMSKLMTTYAVFKRLKQGSLNLNDQFMVSEKPGERVAPKCSSMWGIPCGWKTCCVA